jgi:sugar O-acyltransferase (sialic acid O-acetyltransferase NeuD family)
MRTAVLGSRPDGHARVVIELFGAAPDIELVGLLDDFAENSEREIGGLTVIGAFGDLDRLKSEGLEAAILGFGAARGRAAALAAVEQAGLLLPSLVHPTAFVASSAEIAPGCQLLPRAHVGPAAKVGRGALINTAAIVEHDADVGEAAVIDPGAVVAGRAVIGCEAEVGSGAVVLPDVRIGARAIVGAGAVVTRDVAENITVVGVPARSA